MEKFERLNTPNTSNPSSRARRALAIGALASLILTAPLGCTKRGDSARSASVGNTFLFNLQVEPESLNPITGSDLYGTTVRSYIMESLMERNIDTYEWQPALAEKFEVNKDGTVFTFTLREGVTWSDGQPFTAEDVKFSFDAIFDDKYSAAQLRPYYEGIEKVEIVDPRTVRFTTKNKYFRNFDTAAGMTIVPKHIYGDAEKGSKLNKTVTGTGAYMIEKYDQGQALILVKNPKWWGWGQEVTKGQNNFERIRMRFTRDQDTALEQLKKGDLDYIDMNPEAFERKATGPEWGQSVFKVQYENLEPKSYGYIGMNLKRPLFKDRDVRLALAHLTNRREMIEKFRFGKSLPATGPWYQQSEYAAKDVAPIEFDPAKAAELLRKKGWADSDKDGVLDKVIDGKKTPFRFTLFYANKDNEKYWILFQSDLKRAGIQLELQQLEWNALIKKVDEKDFDTIAMGWGGGAVDLDPKQIWHSSSSAKGGSNYISYNNPEVDRAIDKARGELDKKKRIPLLQDVYRKIAADVPYIFLFNDKFGFYGHTARIQMEKPARTYAIGTSYWSIKAEK